ncbi:MAG: class Ib ribonucleoside-diphosphate reductase assembly flavoprotein NrdI [Corynebacterium sp.]|uniref:class Ib ribonucleoside-diphosphate reductase assembly flavoprotein NrdI n=1 Tax=uncultured Corynebacterium sp. TaxID=159447 RepID=UPI0017D6D834|nr:class Ib ribonucleoside-diphosphate reductase assembly flavoprotein NrdI [uncultured Corynebacterium sp.]NLZ56791.1 class Ib ribonucleoside-diphosphate reductase assembly flavoprotein NrdI [Corynebacterium sp.]
MLVVYFSSVTDNTHRFVQKLGLPNVRIPLTKAEEPLSVDEPYVLVVPTYGGGVTMTGKNSRPVPPQVIRFLNDEHNRSFIRAVVAGGNSNFGTDFGLAGEVIAKKCKVPYVYRFELMGNEEDVRILRGGLIQNAETLGLGPVPESVAALALD